MKKVILTLTFVFSLGYGGYVRAQNRATDDFFKSNYEMFREENQDWGTMPLLPRTHGYDFDYSAAPSESEPTPIGSGLIVMGVLGCAYLTLKRKDQ